MPRRRSSRINNQRGGERNEEEERDLELARREGLRVNQLEAAARAVFKDGRTVKLNQLRQFLEETGGEDALAAFEESKSQAAKLALVWGFEFDPALTDVELLSWVQENENGEQGEGKDKYQLNVEELSDYLLTEMKVPEALVETLSEMEVDAKILVDFTDDDLAATAGGNVSYKRWLKKILREFAPKESVPTEKESKSQVEVQLAAALQNQDYELAANLVDKLKDGGNNRERRRIHVEKPQDPADEFMSNMQREEDMRLRLEAGRSGKQEQRISELRRRLGDKTDRDVEIGNGVSFLEITVDTKSALRQVEDLLSPTKSTVRYDAAHRLRAEAQGYETSYPVVKLNVPEGMEAVLLKIDLITRNLRKAKRFTGELSRIFDHIRTLIRNYSGELQPMELGYLAEGAMKLALSSTRKFEKLFCTGIYTESVPDAVLSKVRLCAKRKEEHLRMLSKVQAAIDNAKRPVVVQSQAASGYKRDRNGAATQQRSVTNQSSWKLWPDRLMMYSEPTRGVRPQYRILKILKQRMHELKQKNEYRGEECRKCCLYHASGAPCDIFLFPGHRTSQFKDLWRRGQADRALPSAVEEWNGRGQRLPQNRVNSDGKNIARPTSKGPGL